MEVSGQLYALADLPPGERTPGAHCIGGWMGPRTGLGDVEKGIEHRFSGRRTYHLVHMMQSDLFI
jgi:hypothetical protein